MIKTRSNDSSEAPCFNAQLRTKTEWDALAPDELEQFNRKVVCRTYSANQIIFLQDDPCKGLYFVEDGLITVRKNAPDGQSAIVRLAYQGDTLGYRPLLAGENHQASAEVVQDARICFIDSATIRGFLLANPKLGMRFLEHTAQALGDAEERMYQVAALSVRTRIIHLMLLLRSHHGTTASDGTLIVTLPMSRRNLAEMIGARPETMSRTFREIQDDGIFSISGQTVRIENYGALAQELHQNLHN